MELVVTEKDMEAFARELHSERSWIVDVETSGFSSEMGANICGIAFGPKNKNDEYYLPVRHAGVVSERGFCNLEPKKTFDFLRPFFADEARSWIGFNLKFEIRMFRVEEISILGSISDTMILWHCADSSLETYSMESLAKRFLPNKSRPAWEALEIRLNRDQRKIVVGDDAKKTGFNYSLVPIEILGPYAMEDIRVTRDLIAAVREKMRPERHIGTNYGLPTWGFSELWKNEMDLVRVLAEMEADGIGIDLKKAVSILEERGGLAEGKMQEMWDLCGEVFKPSRWKLFAQNLEKCGGRIKYWSLPERGKEKKEGRYKKKQKGDQFTENMAESTGRVCLNSAAVLRYLKEFRESGNAKAYAFMEAFHRWHSERFILNTFVVNLLKHVDEFGRVHGNFDQSGTKTGRLSAHNPNLQNQTKEKGTHDQAAFEEFFERRDAEAANRKIRGLFVPRPGHVFVCWDYKSLEYRLAAFASRDKELLEKYRADPDLDYHQETFKIIGFSRDVAKTVNFGLLYGMSCNSLRSLLNYLGFNLTLEQVKILVQKIYAARPALKRLIDGCARNAAESGYVRNPFGRWVAVPSGASYKALNTLLQGTGGEIMRFVLVKIWRAIKKNRWPLRLLLTVHDEIVGELPEGSVREIGSAVARIMEDIPMIDLPLPVDIKVCRENWGKRESFSA